MKNNILSYKVDEEFLDLKSFKYFDTITKCETTECINNIENIQLIISTYKDYNNLLKNKIEVNFIIMNLNLSY